MAKNFNLTQARVNKNDEHYTKLEDIESEISSHQDYLKYFKGKTVLCNCDDPEWSAFFEFFRLHFKQLGLKKLIATHYNPPQEVDGEIISEPSYKLEWEGEMLNDDTINMIKTPLKENGDFRSEECIELLDEADIVVTNPPFSIARDEYLPLLIKHKKDFVIIGDINWINFTLVYPRMKSGELQIGYTSVKEFRQPDGSMKKFGNKRWITNFELDKINYPVSLTKNYYGNEDSYPKFDNYDAINVERVKKIPKDYFCGFTIPKKHLAKLDKSKFIEVKTDQDLSKPINIKNNKKIYKYFYKVLNNSFLVFANHQKAEKINNYLIDELSIPKKDISYCNGLMGVPISIFENYCPDQFFVVASSQTGCHPDSMVLRKYKEYLGYKPDGTSNGRTGSTCGNNPMLEKNDGSHAYYKHPSTGHTVQSTYPKIFIYRKIIV